MDRVSMCGVCLLMVEAHSLASLLAQGYFWLLGHAPALHE